jgi:alkaline phosphatase D
MQIQRRTFIAGAGALGLTAISSAPAFAQKIADFPFTLGVASGDPWPDGFVLWTRLAPRPLEAGAGMPAAIFTVRWELATDSKFTKILRSGEAMAAPEMGHSVHVELTGLQPATRYWYRFLLDRHVSTVGAARTAPAAMSDVAQVRIGVAGCQNYEHGFFTAYKYMAAENLDAVFHYGDYIYEGRQGNRSEIPVVREHLGPEPTTLELYRTRYALYKLDPDLQAAHASTAFLMTFDDHEVDNNFAGARDQDDTAPEVFLARRFAAFRAWYENMPVRAGQVPADDGVQMYRRLDYGNLLRIHLMDTRQYRIDQVCTVEKDRTCRPIETLDTGLILGDRQHQWLEDGLDNRYTWNLIGQQVVVMPYARPSLADGSLEIAADSWMGYPESRRRLVASLKNKKIVNAVIATGDVHQNIIGYIPENDAEPDRNQVATEFVCTSISSLGDGKDIKVRGPDFRKVIAQNPNVFFANGQRGYQVFTITPATWRTDIMKVDKVTDHTGQLSRLAGFTMEKGSPLAIPS